MSLTNRILVSVAIIAIAVAATSAGAQQKGKGRRGFGGGGGNSLATIAAVEAVQKDIGASGDVAGKLTSLRDDYLAAAQKENQTAGIDFQNITPEQRQKLAEVGRKLNDEFNPKVKALVSADQYKRLQQIQLQAGLRNQGPPALTAPEVASELQLTNDQKQKLNELNTEFGRKQRELLSGGGFDQQAFAKLRDERTTKTMDVLTAEQKEKLKGLQGTAFDVAQIGFGGRRGKGN